MPQKIAFACEISTTIVKQKAYQLEEISKKKEVLSPKFWSDMLET